ncbi:hypothetical protein [Pedobacter sp. P26]|uniref:hypothetical protein n=1 Tax=Pedobacter sp. P26 TaxID=3423956 RepID=UPI003D676BDA
MSFDIANNVALQQVLATMEVERKRIAGTQTKGYIFIAAGILLCILGFFLGCFLFLA